VTGAGGSIGSELCRQISSLGPNSIILVERNEFSLYTIENELLRILETSSSHKPNIQAVLCDATNAFHLQSICNTYSVNTVFHAAAYKHVPMVEANLCSGVANNILATKAIIEAANNSTVERLTLISTDKAVRPTNAMGASKRVCELLIQSAANAAYESNKIFTMVRFGNVLGSSGSVIPLFHQQIAHGGPVTVTHPDITRYFMTIPEAVALVLQATGMAAGGELFLLDMGEPVRISDLARQMIELSGLRVKDEHNPDGDISILYTGLRPGEKLYEELLISNMDFKTSHPLIRKAHEPEFDPKLFKQLFDQLEDALKTFNIEQSSSMLRRLVPEYGFSSVQKSVFRSI
jgi:FlaA1/EpsC-like NDP-sugar epimerase